MLTAPSNGAAADPDTLAGQLRRGRGIGAHRALIADTPDTAEIIYGCVRDDPRDDHQTETRTWYLTRLITRLGLPIEPIVAHLFAPVDPHDDDEWRIDLAINILIELANDGQPGAAEALSRYVTCGRYWEWTINGMWARGGHRLCDGLDLAVLDRIDDDALGQAVDPAWGPWRAWAATHPRIRSAVELRQAELRAALAQRLDLSSMGQVPAADLVAWVRSAPNAVIRRLAMVELGRRGDPVVLDLAEAGSLRNTFGQTPGLVKALRALGPAATDRARAWTTGDDPPLADHAVTVLADHGDQRDIPLLLTALAEAAHDENWCAAETPARGLGRLRASEATATLQDLWTRTTHSYPRTSILIGLCGAAPDLATGYLDEALDDCEPGVRVIACRDSVNDPTTLTRVRAHHEDPTEHEDVRTAARQRLTIDKPTIENTNESE
jgi:hypothetical protein